MGNPFDRPSGPPPDFAEGADAPLAPVIPLRPAARSSGRTGEAGQPRGRHPAGTRRDGAPDAGHTGTRWSPKDRPAPDPIPDRDPDPHDVARKIVIRQLAGAPRSRRQLADKLAQRGVPQEVAASVLDQCERAGLINDQEFAEQTVRSQRESRGLGRRGVEAELRRRGVDPQTAKDAVGAIRDEDERDRATELIRTRLTRMHGLEPKVQARRLAGMLARKGYSGELAWSVIREVMDDAPEHQPD